MGVLKYARDPALFVRKVRWALLYAGRRRDVTVDTANGLLTFDSRDKLIGKYLYVNRAYEADYLARAIRAVADGGHRLPGGGTLLSIGANIGMIPIALLRQGLFKRAVAVEPTPASFRLLTHNVAQNGLTDRFRCLQFAVSDSAGTLELELSAYNSGDNRLRHPSSGNPDGAYGEARRRTIQVPVRPLDDVVADEPWLRPRGLSLVWIDIQGFEGRCFAGGRSLFAHGPPVVTEFWPYGIRRSGMTPAQYMEVAEGLFSHVHDISFADSPRQPISALRPMFNALRSHKDYRELLLVPRR